LVRERRARNDSPGVGVQLGRALVRTVRSGRSGRQKGNAFMDSIIYLVGLVVVVLAILSFVGLA
jgi:hypothetical protein